MAAKKPPPAFEVLFAGPGIYPEKIPLGTLARSLAAIHRLAAGKEAPEEEEAEELEDASVRLLDVIRGSAVFRFVGPSPSKAIHRLREVGKVLQHPESIGDKDFMLGPIERLSASAKSLGCSIVVRKAGPDNGVLARIEPNSFEVISESIFVSGESVLTGRVERVGGATERKCGLRVPFQERLMFCKVATVDAARRLGEHLYENVVVDGKATWIKTSWRLIGFTILDVRRLAAGSIMEAMEALREAGGKGWDAIEDPESFLETVSG